MGRVNYKGTIFASKSEIALNRIVSILIGDFKVKSQMNVGRTIQESEMLIFSDKLKRSHIEWRKQVMKVHLAAHTLSASVADALEFLDQDMEIAEFANVSPTVQFIRLIDQLFDRLNSRNIFSSGFKAPLRKTNQNIWEPFFIHSIEYLKNCKTVDNLPIIKSQNKTPFVGFVICAMSFMNIANDYLEENELKYLFGYKFSQDHLELFFCSIRSRNGWNNNLTALQFIRAYKKLLMHHDVKNMTGNCIPQDNTNVLCVSSARIEPSSSEISRLRLQGEELNSAIEEMINLPVNFELTDLAENVVTYISGYVVKMLHKKIICDICKKYLEEEYCPQDDNSFKLLQRKQRGGLEVPVKDLREICLFVEKKIRNSFFIHNKMPHSKNYRECLVNETTQYFVIAKPHILREIDDHIFELSTEEDSHRKKVIQEIASSYCRIRLFNLAKRHTEGIRGENIRTTFSRMIIFRHQ